MLSRYLTRSQFLVLVYISYVNSSKATPLLLCFHSLAHSLLIAYPDGGCRHHAHGSCALLLL